MKKLAPCAVLLAVALAFVGCNLQDDEPEGTTTLQEALNGGGDVNLDEYNPSASETYTISKSKVITGNAKGANFAIADGAAVTFDGTKNIGTVTVGSSTSLNAVVRAVQNTNGATITLNNGVTIRNVFIYVETCTLSSDSTTNSFENVVVASTVKNLTLADKTKVSALVSADSASTITITVDATVTIAEADATVITAVEKSNKTVADKIEKILSSTLEDLKDELEESKKDPVDSTNFITTKDDLIKCVKNIIKKYYDFACEIEDRNSRNRAATASKDDISSQLKNAFDAVYVPFYNDEELAKSFIKLFTGAGATKNIKFEGKVDLTNVGVNTGMDAFIDFANYAQEYFTSDDNETSKTITRKTLFGSNYYTVNDFLDIADKYASVPRLYLLGKLNVNAAAKGTEDYASATAKADIQIEATNINGMIPELFQAYSNNIDHTYVPTSVNLPVTAVKPFINVDANVALTKNQYDDFVQKCKDIPGWEDEPEWDFQYDAYCPKEPKHPFTYPEFDWSNYTPEAYEQWQNDRNAKRQEFEETHPDVMEEYYQALDQYREESNAFNWNEYYQKRNEAYYEYSKEYDKKWDAWYENHRKEIKDYFLKANYASKACSCKINAGVSTTVTSTASVPGGIITLSVEGNYTDPGKIIALVMEGPMGSDYVEILRELEKDYGIKPTVTVTDYNGKETFKTSSIDDIIYVVKDIVDNIGDIIQ